MPPFPVGVCLRGRKSLFRWLLTEGGVSKLELFIVWAGGYWPVAMGAKGLGEVSVDA